MRHSGFPRYMRMMAPFLLVIVSAMVAVCAYYQALNYPFISDDKVYITGNDKLIGLSWNELWRLFVEPYNPWELLPLRDFSYWLDITWFGMNPSVFRIDNIILYLLCCLIVYATTRSLWRHFRPAEAASAPWVAAIVTCLFTVHPAHVEAVIWVSSRKDVLSGMFAMLALWFAVNTKREQGLSASYAIATLFALLTAMLSKASAVAVAPFIALLWFVFWRDIPVSSRRPTTLLWPLAVLIVAAGVTMFFSANSSIKYSAYFGTEAVTRTLAILGWLTRLAISPEGRHYIYPVLDGWLIGMVALGIIVLVAAAAGVVMLLRKRSLEGLALILFLLLCLPYAQLVPFSADSLVSDRFLFLAVWPIALLIVALLWRIHPLLRTALLCVLVLPWIYQSVERPKDWIDIETLFERDYSAWPEHYSLAYAYIIDHQLPDGLYREARKTAENITVPEARDIMMNLVEAEQAIAEARTITDSYDAMTRLQNLGLLLARQPARSKWDPPLHNFWIKCNLSYVSAWQKLVRAFPNDSFLQENFRASVMKYAGH